MKSVMVVAPHADDETLGCGGALARLAGEGAAVHWVLMTRMTAAQGFTAARMRAREREIAAVARVLGIRSVRRLGFPAAGLDAVPLSEVVRRLGKEVAAARPGLLFVPGAADAHSDHRVAFAAAAACAKPFRSPWLKRVLMYETLSETDAALGPGTGSRPTSWCDVTETFERKLQALRLWGAELGEHPFPRSLESARALAVLRGAQSGCRYAEAFEVLRERW